MISQQKEFWENYWSKEKRSSDKFLFAELLKSLNIENINSYFEFGCAPGSIMAHFHKEYKCKVCGIDLVDREIMNKYLDEEGVMTYEAHQGSLFEFDSDTKYDFVASYGLIEHFHNYEEIINKHKSLVADNGYLFISVPNMRYINYLINRLFDKDFLASHNLDVMDLKLLKKLILDDQFIPVFANYYLTSYFQANEDSSRLNSRPKIKKVYHHMNRAMKHTKVDNIPNRVASPYIAVLAKKIK